MNRDTAGMDIRGIHRTHYGRICPIETPEGKNAGLVNSLTTAVHLNPKGFLETPFIEIYKQHVQNQKKLYFYSVENQDRRNVLVQSAFPKSKKNLSVAALQAKKSSFQKCSIYSIDLIALTSQQFISIATTCIPFIEHNDANRALMGSNMQRQALPLINNIEQPLVNTFNSFRVLSDLKDIPTTSTSGKVVYVSHKKITLHPSKNEKNIKDGQLVRKKKIEYKKCVFLKILLYEKKKIFYIETSSRASFTFSNKCINTSLGSKKII